MLCAVLAVVVVLTAVVIYLAVRTADLKRNLEVSAETAKALSALSLIHISEPTRPY